MTIYEYNEYRKIGNERARTDTKLPKMASDQKIAKIRPKWPIETLGATPHPLNTTLNQ